MNLPTKDQAEAFGRHIITFASGAVVMFASLHLITGGDAQSATTALNQISHGFSEIIAGGGTLIGIGSGVVAALSASPLIQLLKGAIAVAKTPALAKDATVAQQATVASAIEALPQVQTVIASAAVAGAAPSPSVISTTDVKVVNK